MTTVQRWHIEVLRVGGRALTVIPWDRNRAGCGGPDPQSGGYAMPPQLGFSYRGCHLRPMVSGAEGEGWIRLWRAESCTTTPVRGTVRGSGRWRLPRRVLRNYTKRNPDPHERREGPADFKMIVIPACDRRRASDRDGCSTAARSGQLHGETRTPGSFGRKHPAEHYYTRSIKLRAKIARGPKLTRRTTNTGR